VSGRPAALLPLGRREGALRVLVLLFAAGLFAFRLGAGSLWDTDEPRYAQIGREIVATGDPMTPRLEGRPWFGRPPLWTWLLAASGRVFGFSEWSVRVCAAAFGLVGVGAAMALGREWFGPRTGVLSGLVLATMLEYLVVSRLAVLDTAFVALLLLALRAFYRAYRDRTPRDYVRSFLYTGLATLTGGPVGLLLPALVLVLFLAYRGTLARWREVPWIWGGLVYLAIVAPWYAIGGLREGRAFWVAAVGDPGAVRLPQAIAALPFVALYHALVLVLGAVPWTAFLPGAVAYHYRRRWQDGSLLCLLWCAATFAVAVGAGHSLPDEVFPVYPLAAVAIARLWEEFLFEGGMALRRTLATSFLVQIGVVVFLIAAAVAFATVRYPQAWASVRGALAPPLGMLVLGTAATAVLFRSRRYTAAFLALPATMAAFVGILYTITGPAVEAQKPVRPLAALLRGAARAGDRIIGYRIGPLASLVYYAGHPVEWIADPAMLERRLCARGRVFLVTTADELGALVTAPAAAGPPAAGLSQGDAYRPPAAGALRAGPGGSGPRLPLGLRTLGAAGTWVLTVKPAAVACGRPG